MKQWLGTAVIGWLVGICAPGCTRGAGTTAPPTDPKTLAAAAAAMKDILDVGDVVRIEVFGEKELTGNFQVSDAGTIDYPLVGRVDAKGMTPPELADLLKRRLANGYLRNPSVNVFPRNFNKKKRVFVWGQVQKAGTFNYVNAMSLIEAITLAGGLTPLANKDGVTVTRVDNGKSNTVNVPVGDSASASYRLQPGDVIFVPERIF
ncbi:MAG: polysaccharide export protein [Deltaproteobacteria bacterium]|nr:polysaccharide export protein [Deltaproteobacteria bacterium]